MSLTVTFTLADAPVSYKEVPNGHFFAFVSHLDGIMLCYKNAQGTFQYLTLGPEDTDACPSVSHSCECHPDNAVRIATLTRTKPPSGPAHWPSNPALPPEKR